MKNKAIVYEIESTSQPLRISAKHTSDILPFSIKDVLKSIQEEEFEWSFERRCDTQAEAEQLCKSKYRADTYITGTARGYSLEVKSYAIIKVWLDDNGEMEDVEEISRFAAPYIPSAQDNTAIKRNICEAAAALFDGGWRASDREKLISEYKLTVEEADEMCYLLKTAEKNETN